MALVDRRLASLLSLIMLTGFIQAAAGSSPWEFSKFRGEVEFSGELEVRRASRSEYVAWAEASLYAVPQDSIGLKRRLIEVSPETYRLEQDSFGNDYIVFRWDDPNSDRLPYRIAWGVESDPHARLLPEEGIAGPDEETYVETDKLTLWTPYIRTKAEFLANGSESDLETMQRLSAWISRFVEYDKTYWHKTLPAEDTFRGRRGVCDEFANLFISMARSLGMPARYVEGLVFNGDKWDFHAWAEVYSGGWVPVDPTYSEVGFLDATHIPLARAHGDNDIYNRIRWASVGAEVGFESDDMSVKISNFDRQSLLDLDVGVKEDVAGAELFEAEAEVRNSLESHVVATCRINMPTEMIMTGWREKFLVLEPGKSGRMSWGVASPPGLDEEWLHSMPLQIKCFPHANFSTEVVVDPRTENEAVFSASVTDLTVLNRTDALVRVKNNGTQELRDLTVTVCHGDGHTVCFNETINLLEAGESADARFTGLYVKGGSEVSAALHSKELEGSSLHARISESSEKEATVEGGQAPEIFDAEKSAGPRILMPVMLVAIALAVVLAAALSVKKR